MGDGRGGRDHGGAALRAGPAPPPREMIGRGRFGRPFLIVGVALFVWDAYFYQAGGRNQNSRFALVRAMVERQTLRIDAYQDSTNDLALSGGHSYSDEAPGASFLAVLPVDIARAIARAAGVNPDSPPGIAWMSYIADSRDLGRVHCGRGAVRDVARVVPRLLARRGDLCGDGVRRREPRLVLRDALSGRRRHRRMPDDRVLRRRGALAPGTQANTAARVDRRRLLRLGCSLRVSRRGAHPLRSSRSRS